MTAGGRHRCREHIFDTRAVPRSTQKRPTDRRPGAWASPNPTGHFWFVGLGEACPSLPSSLQARSSPQGGQVLFPCLLNKRKPRGYRRRRGGGYSPSPSLSTVRGRQAVRPQGGDCGQGSPRLSFLKSGFHPAQKIGDEVTESTFDSRRPTIEALVQARSKPCPPPTLWVVDACQGVVNHAPGPPNFLPLVAN